MAELILTRVARARADPGRSGAAVPGPGRAAHLPGPPGCRRGDAGAPHPRASAPPSASVHRHVGDAGQRRHLRGAARRGGRGRHPTVRCDCHTRAGHRRDPSSGSRPNRTSPTGHAGGPEPSRIATAGVPGRLRLVRVRPTGVVARDRLWSGHRARPAASSGPARRASGATPAPPRLSPPQPKCRKAPLRRPSGPGCWPAARSSTRPTTGPCSPSGCTSSLPGATPSTPRCEPAATRHITMQAQTLDPTDESRQRVLLPLVFCRECGPEYYAITKTRPDDHDGATGPVAAQGAGRAEPRRGRRRLRLPERRGPVAGRRRDVPRPAARRLGGGGPSRTAGPLRPARVGPACPSASIPTAGSASAANRALAGRVRCPSRSGSAWPAGSPTASRRRRDISQADHTRHRGPLDGDHHAVPVDPALPARRRLPRPTCPGSC